MSLSHGHSTTLRGLFPKSDFLEGFEDLALNLSSHKPFVFVDAETLDILSDVILSYILPILFVIGAISNVLCLVVLCAEKKKNTTTMILIALSISDLGFITCKFAMNVSNIMEHFDAVAAQNYFNINLGIHNFVNFVFSTINSLITTLISVERCVAVFFPLKIQSVCTSKRILAIIAIIYAGSFIMFIPLLPTGDIQWITNPTNNVSIAIYVRNKFYMDNVEFFTYYGHVFINAISQLLPCAIVSINTIAIIIKLKRAREWREDSSKTSNEATVARERKMTIILVVLCLVFLAGKVPGAIFQICRLIVVDFAYFGKYRNLYLLVSTLVELVQYINSCINFVLYMALNARFVKIFLEIFGCNRKASK